MSITRCLNRKELEGMALSELESLFQIGDYVSVVRKTDEFVFHGNIGSVLGVTGQIVKVNLTAKLVTVYLKDYPSPPVRESSQWLFGMDEIIKMDSFEVDKLIPI